MKTHIKTTQMRKLTLLLLLFTGMVNAQIVNIPDANFKAKLLAADVTNTIASTANNATIPDTFNKIDINNDGEIQQSEAASVTLLNVSNSNISDLAGIEEFISLRSLKCFDNQITNLNIDQSNNLVWLDCQNNNLTSLNINNKIFLQLIFCNNNQLSNLTLNNLSSLTSIYCSNNQLTFLDANSATNLYTLDCSNNQLINLDVSSNIALIDLTCSYNQLVTLDCSNNLNLTFLSVIGNSLLESLFIKNGAINETNVDSFIGCTNLNYICADENEISTTLQNLDFGSIPNVVVNSYCSFTPGGNYNTITGNLKFDSDNNGCDANDLPQPNIRVNINDGANTGASFTNTIGDYKFYTQAGSFDITPEIENPTWFTFTPTNATIPFADNNNNIATQDFCIAANGVHHDVEMVIVPTTPARPGFDAVYKLVYKNNGNQIESFVAPNFYYNDTVLDLVSTSLVPAVSGVGFIQWYIPSLLPFQSGEITITLNVNAPTEMPSVNIGDVLAFSSIIDIVTDENWNDNNFTFNQTVVGSYDPNDITCLEGNNVAPSEIGEYLHYVINFENTGNYPAENVVVKTIVDTTKFDVNSLQLLNTSNPVDARITGNVVEFIFENIQLGGPGGHGHILLKIKSKNTLVAGDAVAKNANIYFDYNAPVDTGIATTVFQSLSNTVFEKDDSIKVSPNPTNSKININSNFNIKKVELYDVQGRVLETQIGETETIDISEKSNGIYFLKITTEKGSKVEKVVKK